MPINTSRYPANWAEIALEVKDSANWRCKHCGKECLTPNQSKRVYAQDPRKWGQNTLTVHHIDHDRSNNERSNLIALCAPCHLARHQREQLYGVPNPAQLSLI